MRPPHTRQRFLAVVLLFLVLAFQTSAVWARSKRAAKKTEAPVISSILIRSTNIFDFENNPALHHFPYTTINMLHFQTKEAVIRRELLFKVGDRLDPYLIAETERNLRALPGTRSARIARFPQRDGTVLLVVYANDAWTTEPQINLAGTNGVDVAEIGFKEKNLFGWGKTIQYFYDKNARLAQNDFKYTDPRLLGSRLRLVAGFANGNAGDVSTLLLERPFFSADTRWSASVRGETRSERLKEIEDNVEVNQYVEKEKTAEAYVAAKIGSERQVVNHLGPAIRTSEFRYETNNLSDPNRQIPDNRNERILFLRFDSTHNNFIQTYRVEKMTRLEDINLGPAFSLAPGYQPPVTEQEKSNMYLESSLSQSFLFPNDDYLNYRVGYGGRNINRSAENEAWNLDVRYLRRLTESNTLALHTRGMWGYLLNPNNYLRLGSETGLRAVEPDSLVGSRGVVFNVEDRLYGSGEIASLFALGAVAFYDAGAVWDQNSAMQLSDFKSIVGAGLRLGLTRSSGETIVRLDFGYRLQTVPEDPGNHWVFTFGTGQAF